MWHDECYETSYRVSVNVGVRTSETSKKVEQCHQNDIRLKEFLAVNSLYWLAYQKDKTEKLFHCLKEASHPQTLGDQETRSLRKTEIMRSLRSA